MNLKRITSLFFASLFLSASAILPCTAQSNGSLKVGVAGSPPFIMDTIEQTGISLEIWQKMANLGNINYNLVPFEDVSDALTALEEEKVDIVVGPISITPDRIGKFWFTQPYYMTNLTVMAKNVSPTIWQRIKPYFSIHFFYAIFIFLFIMVIIGTVLWLSDS